MISLGYLLRSSSFLILLLVLAWAGGADARTSSARSASDSSFGASSTKANKKGGLSNVVRVSGGSSKATKRSLTAADLALAGAAATMLGDTILHPIDCIKTLQQSNEGAGLGLLGASRSIMKKSGPVGFYSGLGTYVTADGGAGALKFAAYEGLKQFVADRMPAKYHGSATFGCAAIAYLVSSVVLVPGELIKQRLQMGTVSSVGGAASSIWRNEGISGFFAGASGVYLRDIPYTILELGLYDNIKAFAIKMKKSKAQPGDESNEASQKDEIIAAAIAGAITGYLTTPPDFIKTKLMLYPEQYSNIADATRKCIQEGGIASLFNGAGARVSYIMPFCTFYLPVYEIIKRKLEVIGIVGDSNKSD